MPTSPTPTAVRPNRIVVFGGGTIMHVRNHMALCAPAYGGTAKKLANMLSGNRYRVDLMLTKMADSTSDLETNDDVKTALMDVLAESNTVGIVFNVALCDFSGQIGLVASGKYAERLQTREVTEGGLALTLRPTEKLLTLVQQLRPDIVSVGFKTTANETAQVQVAKSNRMAREAGVSWMLANDTVTRNNIVLRGSDTVAPYAPRTVKEAVYNGLYREQALQTLAHQFLQTIQRNE